jgi:hypothetical protein
MTPCGFGKKTGGIGIAEVLRTVGRDNGFPPGFCRFYAIDRMTPCGFGEKTGGIDAPGVSRTGGRDSEGREMRGNGAQMVENELEESGSFIMQTN